MHRYRRQRQRRQFQRARLVTPDPRTRRGGAGPPQREPQTVLVSRIFGTVDGPRQLHQRIGSMPLGADRPIVVAIAWKHAFGPHPAGAEIAARARTLTRARVLRRKAGVRISAAPLSRSLALSPKLSGAHPPNRATRATIALPESDRPDGREPAMSLPRKGTPAGTDADDRFADSRHLRRTLAFNGSRTSAVRVSSERHRRRLGRLLLAQGDRSARSDLTTAFRWLRPPAPARKAGVSRAGLGQPVAV